MLSQNGQTHLNNLVAHAARFSKWVKPFREIAHEDLPSVETGNKSDGAIVSVIMKTLWYSDLIMFVKKGTLGLTVCYRLWNHDSIEQAYWVEFYNDYSIAVYTYQKYILEKNYFALNFPRSKFFFQLNSCELSNLS